LPDIYDFFAGRAKRRSGQQPSKNRAAKQRLFLLNKSEENSTKLPSENET
jgi:hypothetical protein